MLPRHLDWSSEKNDEHKEYVLNHGSYESAYDIKIEDAFVIVDEEEEESEEEEEKDNYIEDDDEEYVNDYDDEPNDADILDIEENYLLNDPTLQQSKSEKTVAEKKPRVSKAKAEKAAKTAKTKADKTVKEPKKTTAKKTTSKAKK